MKRCHRTARNACADNIYKNRAGSRERQSARERARARERQGYVYTARSEESEDLRSRKKCWI